MLPLLTLIADAVMLVFLVFVLAYTDTLGTAGRGALLVYAVLLLMNIWALY